MSETKAAYHHGDLRNALVETAIGLVRSVGAEAFSLRDAAKQLGVSANATYRHFSNKAELLLAVAVAGRDQLAFAMRRAVNAAERANARRDATARAHAYLSAAGHAYVDFALEQPELYRLMYGRSGICKSNEPADAYRILSEALARLIDAGVIDAESSVDGELRLWTLLHGFASLVLEGAKPFAESTPLPDAIDDVLAFALRGLGGAPARASSKKRA